MKELFTTEQLFAIVAGQVYSAEPEKKGAWMDPVSFHALDADEILEAYDTMSEEEQNEFDEDIISEAKRREGDFDSMDNGTFDLSIPDEEFFEARNDSVRYIENRISESLSEYLI